MGRVTHTIDSTLLWSLRIVGLLILAVVVYLAFKVLVTAFAVLLTFVAIVVIVVMLIRRRLRQASPASNASKSTTVHSGK